MTLAITTLKVEVGPRSVGVVRRWVAEACLGIGRPDLIDCARLAVSELVTNALLHGAPPISVSMRGTVEHPRIEVSDGSPRPPASPVHECGPVDNQADGPVDGMATTGRGLRIVAKCSTAWGVEVEGRRKIVWFEPASEVLPDVDPPFSMTVTETVLAMDADQHFVPVTIYNADAQICYSLLKHYRDLRRELRLLALTHSEDYPLAKQLSELIIAFEREFPQEAIAQLDEALTAGRSHLDINVRTSPDLAPLIPKMLEVLDLADAFCRAQQFLAIARTEHQNAYCHWFLGEFARQAQGGGPRLWDDVSNPSRTQEGT